MTTTLERIRNVEAYKWACVPKRPYIVIFFSLNMNVVNFIFFFLSLVVQAGNLNTLISNAIVINMLIYRRKFKFRLPV